jgi:hypothetical protein
MDAGDMSQWKWVGESPNSGGFVKMRVKFVHILSAAVWPALWAIVAVLLGGCYGGIVTAQKDADANSGDVRKQVFFLGMPMSDRITESPFSHEIRRLGIDIPEARNWKPMILATSKPYKGEPYNMAIWDCDFLLEMLGLLGVSDEERRTILQGALSDLQTDKLDENADLVYDVADRLRVKAGLPSVPKEQRPKSHNRHVRM